LTLNNTSRGAERFPYFFVQRYQFLGCVAPRAYCKLPRFDIVCHHIAPQCPTRPTSVGLFFMLGNSLTLDTSYSSCGAPHTLHHVPNGMTHHSILKRKLGNSLTPKYQFLSCGAPRGKSLSP